MLLANRLGLALLLLGCLMATTHAFAQVTLLPSALEKSLQTKITEQVKTDPSPNDINAQRKTLEAGLAQAKEALGIRSNELRELTGQNTPEKNDLTDTVRSLGLITARYQHALDGECPSD